MRSRNYFLMWVVSIFLCAAPQHAMAQDKLGEELLKEFFADRRPEIEKIADSPERLKDHVRSKKNVNEAYGNGKTLLHYAANRGYPDVVLLLLEKGASINARDDEGGTPLHEAMRYHRDKVARQLIEKGADVNLRDKEGKTAFFSIVYMDGKARSIALTNLFIEKGFDLKKSAEDNLLEQAISRDRREVAVILLKNGIAVNEVALSRSAAMGDEEIFNMILERGASPNQPRILLNAAESGNLNIVKTLVEKGLLPEAEHIDRALYNGRVEVSSYLNGVLRQTKNQQVDTKERCRMKPVPGSCKALFWYAYFDAAAKICIEASGCGGVMPFGSLEACKRVCE